MGDASFSLASSSFFIITFKTVVQKDYAPLVDTSYVLMNTFYVFLAFQIYKSTPFFLDNKFFDSGEVSLHRSEFRGISWKII